MTDDTTTAPGWQEGGSHRPLALAPGVAAIVRRGTWDVFAVEGKDGRGRRRFLFRAEPGEVLLGSRGEVGAVGLIAVGGVGSAHEPMTEATLADAAIAGFLERLVGAALPPPPPGLTDPLRVGETEVGPGEIGRAHV
jgi:hypothetical protein